MKLSVVWLPSSRFTPLYEAPFTVEVSSWPSEARVVLRAVISALGDSASVSAVWIAWMVVMTLLIAAVAAPMIDWLWAIESLTAPMTPVLACRLWAIDQ